MKTLGLCMAGFGNVGKRFLRLLQEKEAYLADTYGYRFLLTGVCSPSRGILAKDDGLSIDELISFAETGRKFETLPEHFTPWGERGALEMIDRCRADVFLELSTLSIRDGEPATSYIAYAFERGMHAVTANKGPEAWHFDRLREKARAAGKEYLYETAVMDGTPIFNLARETLHGCEILGIKGILNGTSNFVLYQLEHGFTFDEAIREAQRLQFAEADPSMDVDGWDGAAKICAMANVLMNAKLDPMKVERKSIASVTAEEICRAKAEGCRIKYICRAERDEAGHVRLSVLPTMIPLDDVYATVNGASAAVTLHTDLAGELTIVQTDPGILETAYGVCSDLITLIKRIEKIR